MDQDLHGWK